jgi:hypothetical protein
MLTLEMRKGSSHTHEARAKIANARRGRRHSLQTRAMMRTAALRTRLESALYRAASQCGEEIEIS